MIVTPHRVDQPVGAHRPAGRLNQDGQQRPLLRRADVEHHIVTFDRERAQQAVAQHIAHCHRPTADGRLAVGLLRCGASRQGSGRTGQTASKHTDPKGWTMNHHLLIRDAVVVSIDPQIGVLERGDILVQDGRITAVAPDLSDAVTTAVGDAVEVLDGRGMIALPGFVDSHLHAWEGQLRGLAPVVDFAAYLGLTAFGHGPHYRPADIYAGTFATALAALDAGITTIVDNAHNALTPDHAIAGMEAVRDVGIRAVHAVGAPFGSDLPHIPALAADLRDRFAGPLLDVRLFDIHPTPELWAFARAAELWVSSEIGPHTPGLEELLLDLARRGLFTAEHALNHCYDLSDATWRLIADSGAPVNLCPRSDAAFGLGSTTPPVGHALRHATAIGLSTTTRPVTASTCSRRCRP
jgi:5-methylthioadenosine/S-adenosylhomocysteine deaminase